MLAVPGCGGVNVADIPSGVLAFLLADPDHGRNHRQYPREHLALLMDDARYRAAVTASVAATSELQRRYGAPEFDEPPTE
ncbi:hypothetical protein GCM10009738_40070 [Kitasatospora viridis]